MLRLINLNEVESKDTEAMLNISNDVRLTSYDREMLTDKFKRDQLIKLMDSINSLFTSRYDRESACVVLERIYTALREEQLLTYLNNKEA